MLRSSRHTRGFTLMEVLIASALVGLVLALAMSGFMDINKVSNITRSKTLGRQEAAKGLQEVMTLLKRAHVIYFTGQPLTTQASIPAAQINAPTVLAGGIPPLLFSLAAPASAQVQYQFGANSTTGRATLAENSRTGLFGAGARRNRASFRFAHTAGTLLTFAGNRLMTADPSVAANPENLYFPSPLCYWAEATFNTAPTAGRIRDSHLPVSWTFYVLYLAPMNLDFEDAALSYAGAPYNNPMDRGLMTNIPAGTSQANATYPRSTVPFELRLLTIPGVRARVAGAGNHPFDPSDAAADHILGAPFDHFRLNNSTATQQVNYDPYPLPMRTGVQERLGLNDGAPPTSQVATVPRRNGAGVTTTIFASGERVRGGGAHPNYNNIGNDPPTNAALGDRLAGPQPSDKVIASYIDPDSVPGTTIKLGNNSQIPPVAQPWFNAYVGHPSSGFRGHLWNMNNPVGGNEGTIQPPQRAFISITTRFRNNRRIPFQFATETAEVNLETLVSYQTMSRVQRQ